jgi:hypothetical protein
MGATLLLTGCLEQIQTTRIPEGSLSNFLIHLQNGELDDAQAYFAPGLVTPSPQLDDTLKQDSVSLQKYEIKGKKYKTDDLGGGQVRVTASGQVRPHVAAGQPTPGPSEGWQQTDIITARMIERGPGWRILDYQLKCCK